MENISNSINNFFKDDTAKSYFKDTLNYFRTKLTELGIPPTNQLILFEGEVQNRFPPFPLAVIWVFNTQDNITRLNSGLISETYEFYTIEIVHLETETTFAMREQFKRLLLKSPSFTSHDGLNCKINLLGTEPNLVGERRIKSVMFFIKADYKIDGRKKIDEYPVETIDSTGYLSNIEYKSED